MTSHEPSADLLHPELRQHLERYLRRRLPAAEVDDALQAVYCAALEARNVPVDEVHLRRWMTVIARRQVAAYYERTSSEQLGEPPEIEVESDAVETMSMLRWAEKQAAQSQLESTEQTLDWMARESDGEKLEQIAADTRISSANVRQRVFRLRRFMKARWALEISAALVLIGIASWVLTRRSPPVVKLEYVPLPLVSATLPDPFTRAAEWRKSALRLCDEEQFQECLRLLDEAARLDPAGDEASSIVGARQRANERLAPPSPSSLPIRKTPTRTRTSTPSSSEFSSSG
jgi:DNA-directed RNA polymerase specialized sigma24 family protein